MIDPIRLFRVSDMFPPILLYSLIPALPFPDMINARPVQQSRKPGFKITAGIERREILKSLNKSFLAGILGILPVHKDIPTAMA